VGDAEMLDDIVDANALYLAASVRRGYFMI
jgi:hypothetical protein